MTALLLAYALVLLAAVLLSGLAHRTVLSTAVMFLVAGFLLGDGVTGLLGLTPDDDLVATLAELALFAVLFTDGMRVGWADLRVGVAAARTCARLGPAADAADHRRCSPTTSPGSTGPSRC